jgi:hypothetical protein
MSISLLIVLILASLGIILLVIVIVKKLLGHSRNVFSRISERIEYSRLKRSIKNIKDSGNGVQSSSIFKPVPTAPKETSIKRAPNSIPFSLQKIKEAVLKPVNEKGVLKIPAIKPEKAEAKKQAEKKIENINTEKSGVKVKKERKKIKRAIRVRTQETHKTKGERGKRDFSSLIEKLEDKELGETLSYLNEKGILTSAKAEPGEKEITLQNLRELVKQRVADFLEEKLSNLQSTVSDLRKEGKYTRFVEIRLMSAPHKIKIFEATLKKEDLKKVLDILQDIEEEIKEVSSSKTRRISVI